MPFSKKSVPKTDKFTRLLWEKGLRVTRQRRAVNSAMEELVHASADMICDYLARKGHKVTVASVYNILTQFAELGIYGVRMSQGNKMFFDYRTDSHMHMYDTRYGTFMEVEDSDLIKELTARFRKLPVKGYKLDYVDVQLVCHATRKKRTEED